MFCFGRDVANLVLGRDTVLFSVLGLALAFVVAVAFLGSKTKLPIERVDFGFFALLAFKSDGASARGRLVPVAFIIWTLCNSVLKSLTIDREESKDFHRTYFFSPNSNISLQEKITSTWRYSRVEQAGCDGAAKRGLRRKAVIPIPLPNSR